MSVNSDFKHNFHVQLKDFYLSQCGTVKKPWTTDRVLEVITHIKTAKVAMDSGVRRNPAQYYWCKKYDLMNVAGEDDLILKKKNPEDPSIRVVPMEQYFNTLMEIHKECGHGGRDKMLYAIKNKLYIQKRAIEIFVSLCPICESKRYLPKKSLVTKPIISKDFNCRGQVDLIDLQSAADEGYKWLLNYQDHATKFLQLRPLQSKQASEVAQQLIDIFLTFGAPNVLQSDNGREFTAKIIEEIVKMWPECKIVHGHSRHPQTQGSMERRNQEVEDMLRTWMQDNNSTNWSFGCKFVQYQKNVSYHRIIGRSPYSLLFGCNPKSGLQSSNVPGSFLQHIHTEEDLDNIVDPFHEKDKNATIFMPQSSIQAITNNLESSEISKNTTETNIFNNDKNTLSIPRQLKNTHVVDAVVLAIESENNMDISSSASDKQETFDNLEIPVQSSIKWVTKDSEINDISEHTIVADVILVDNKSNVDKNGTVISAVEINKSYNDIDFNQNDLCDSNCVVCGQPSSGAHQCYSCFKPVHTVCGLSDGTEGYGSKVLCTLCNNQKTIINERDKGVKRAAEKMVIYPAAAAVGIQCLSDCLCMSKTGVAVTAAIKCSKPQSMMSLETLCVKIEVEEVCVKKEVEEVSVKKEVEEVSVKKEVEEVSVKKEVKEVSVKKEVEEVSVKKEVEEVSVKEEVKEECENEEPGAHVKEEVECSSDLLDLYPGHQVKDELVLGTEELHRPCVPSTLPVAPNRAEEARERPCPDTLETLLVDAKRRSCRVGLHTYTPRRTCVPHDRREKRFKCSHCDHKCSWKSDLQRHERIHTGEKPFHCSYCDYKCTVKSSLQIHQRRQHTGQKPFQCSYCDYKCTDKSSLIKHQRVHTGDKPYKCRHCDYRCSQKSNLPSHERVHTGKRAL